MKTRSPGVIYKSLTGRTASRLLACHRSAPCAFLPDPSLGGVRQDVHQTSSPTGSRAASPTARVPGEVVSSLVLSRNQTAFHRLG